MELLSENMDLERQKGIKEIPWLALPLSFLLNHFVDGEVCVCVCMCVCACIHTWKIEESYYWVIQRAWVLIISAISNPLEVFKQQSREVRISL